MASRSSKVYDFIVFGVTGFTGKFVAEEIHRIQSTLRNSLKWAVAGRNETKINEALQELGIEGVDVIVADVKDEDSIKNMCSKGRVVIDVVGPYLYYGEVVVKSCIQEGCDYVDITGEEYFVEQMVSKYEEEARKAGVYIVNHCGYDSIPTEIGATLLRRHLGELEYAESYMSVKANVINIGTFESLLMILRTKGKLDKLRKSMADCAALYTEPKTSMPRRRFVFYNPLTQSWYLNMGEGPDKACLKRSSVYRHNTYNAPKIACNVYSDVGSFCRFLVTVLAFCFVIGPLCATRCGFNLLCKYPRLFTAGFISRSGPTKKQINEASCCVIVEGTAADGDKKKARVTMQGGEPAYVVTSVTLVHSAMCLLEERDKLPKLGGIYSPGAAFGETSIVERMEETGKVKFTVKDL